jgi:hypothetical protein
MEGKWRKSAYSDGASNCVELCWDEQVLLTRDSKAPLSGMLSFADTSASAFLAAVKAGQFDR